MSVEEEIVHFLNEPGQRYVPSGSQCVCGFDPMDSDTYDNAGYEFDEEPFSQETQSDQYEGFVPQSPGMYPLPQISLSDTDDTDVPVEVNNNGTVITTDLKNLKAVIQTKSNYQKNERLSDYLKRWPGLMIMPLSAISFIRKPVNKHLKNPQILLYMPNPGEELNSGFPNFIEADQYLREVNN